MRTSSMIKWSTAVTLFGAGALHVAWGQGSSFPYQSAAELADNVAGSALAPSPTACNAVAAVLAGVALTVAVPGAGPLRRASIASMSAVFAVRAAFGFAGRTDVLVAGSESSAFRRNDRAAFSPLCALLAVGLAVASFTE